MSKDFRFRKEDRDDYEPQDWIVGMQGFENKQEQTKAELIRKKRASKILAETRSKQVDDTKSVH
jgi:hypothetical protein